MKIRKLEKSDGKLLLELLLHLDKETKFMLYEEGERKTTAEQTSQKIKNINSSGIIIGAEDNGKLVGFISAQKGFVNRIKHSAYIVIGVLKEASGKGIGTQLMKEVDKWALNNGITKLELTVMVHNLRAFNLYKKMGYEVEGTKRNSVIVDGKLHDEYYMGKILGESV